MTRARFGDRRQFVAAVPAGAQTFNSLNVAAPGAATVLTITNSLNIGTGGLLINDSGNKNVSITGGTLTAGTAAGAELFAYVSTTTGTESIASVIANNAGGAVSFVKNGPGTLHHAQVT